MKHELSFGWNGLFNSEIIHSVSNTLEESTNSLDGETFIVCVKLAKKGNHNPKRIGQVRVE